MQFSSILTSFALLGALTLSPFTPVLAQGRDNTRVDEAILDMAQAYKQRDRKRLTALLPQVRGYVLEPWGAYWELSARLDDAGPSEIQDFMNRYSGTYNKVIDLQETVNIKKIPKTQKIGRASCRERV